MRIRLAPRMHPLAFWVSWYAATLLMVLLIPSYARFSKPIWDLPGDLLPQVLLIGVAYLTLALYLRLANETRGWVAAVVAAIACFGVAGLLLRFGNGLLYSRVLLLVAAALGVPLAFFPYIFQRSSTLIASAVGLAALLFAGGRVFSRRVDVRVAQVAEITVTSLHALSVLRQPNLVAPPLSNGGALAAYQNGFLLVTGSGEFYRLDWESGDRLRSQRLSLKGPEDYRAFLADFQFTEGAPMHRDRITDLLLDTTVSPVRLYLAHQHWNHEKRCFTMRVSTVTQQPAGGPNQFSPDWQSIYETHPCLTIHQGYDDSETGGRLAWARGKRLLMTVGEHGLSGRVERDSTLNLAQKRDADYGKVLLLDGKGGARIFTLGHRNPQGLTVDRQGKIWSTEHGPEGGDELNLIVDGANYGWPLATYGTEYGLDFWPFMKGQNHGAFREPALAFVPSLGISNLIQVGAKQFPKWDGDLLIGSLRRKTLYRVRMRDDRVIYTEPIVIGSEIRDIDEAPDGRIVMWNDEDRGVTVVSLANVPPSGEAVYNSRCFGCHEPLRGGVMPVGPLLTDIVGRKIASVPGYAYSGALRQLGGNWTKERLDSLLSDPARYVPGSRMEFGRVADNARRRAVIEYLARHK